MAAKRKAKPNLGGRPPVPDADRLASPVLVRLNVQSRARLEAMAKREGETLAGMARLILERSLARSGG